MAIPEYFERNAVAVAQAISGLDAERLGTILAKVRVGITIAPDGSGKEGQALIDLLIRLLARLYPTLVLRADHDKPLAEQLRELARRINPRIELSGTPTVEIVIGSARPRSSTLRRIYAGCSAWTGKVSSTRPQSCGDSAIPFGPGIAACLVAANLFRHLFLAEPQLDVVSELSVFESKESNISAATLRALSAEFVLAGGGAIGNAAAWALARAPLQGTLHVVDPQTVDLGNLQRYVLAERADEKGSKAPVLARYFDGQIKAEPHETDLASFLESRDHRIDRLLLALDTARDRRAGQASLPRWVANAWTQPNDLGVSTHDFVHGACVCCLYLPENTQMNEDAIIAGAFGVPDRMMQIRVLLHRNEGVPRDLLEAMAAARNLSLDRLLPFEGRGVRELYVEGYCGGGVIPLGEIGTPGSEVHVPLAHQSALAGVLLAAAAVRNVTSAATGTYVTQLDVLRPIPAFPTRKAAKDPRGICLCQDADYRDVYEGKYRQPARRPEKRAVPAKVSRVRGRKVAL